MNAQLRMLDVADPNCDPRPRDQAAAPVRLPAAPTWGSRLKVVTGKLHLYIALWCGVMFVLLGLTGSAIAWMHELDSALNPELFHATVAPGAAPATAERLKAVEDFLVADPRYGRPDQLQVPAASDEAVVAWYRIAPAGERSAFALNVSRQVMVDATALRVNGERNWGEIGLSRPLLMPTLFNFHHYLVAGEVGRTIGGITGILLAIAGLSGLVLWWPRLRLKALRQALTVTYRGSWPRLNFSLHRAAGFFIAPLLVMQGLSGLYFNLPQWVLPVVGAVATVSPNAKVSNAVPHAGAPLDAAAAARIAQAQFPEARVSRVAMSSPKKPYEVRMRQEGEVRKGDGATRLTIDAYSGAVLRVRDPQRAPGGDTFLNWLFPLHTGEAFGTPGRIFTSLFGIMPLLFMITGVTIWLNRRREKRAAQLRR